MSARDERGVYDALTLELAKIEQRAELLHAVFASLVPGEEHQLSIESAAPGLALLADDIAIGAEEARSNAEWLWEQSAPREARDPR